LWLITLQLQSAVSRHNNTARPTISRLAGCLYCLGPCSSTIVRVGTVRRVHSTFIREFSMETNKIESLTETVEQPQ
jgi:hypothetical protein